MTAIWFLDFRQPEGAPGEIGLAMPGGQLTAKRLADLAVAAADGELVFITHGFNVSRTDGIAQLSATVSAMALPSSHLVVGVLWPGSFVVPVINYPFEHKDAVAAGRRLGKLVGRFPAVSSISGVSHSLGARVMLEAARHAPRPMRLLCLTAAATDNDIFKPLGQYADVLARTGQVVVLHSLADRVLQLAYPAGDLFSDLFLGDKDSPLKQALGYSGPRPMADSKSRKIPTVQGFGHGDYIGNGAKPRLVSRLLSYYLLTGQSAWPP